MWGNLALRKLHWIGWLCINSHKLKIKPMVSYALLHKLCVSSKNLKLCSWLLNLEWLPWLNKLPNSFKHMNFWCLFLEPHQIAYHLFMVKITTQFRHVYLDQYGGVAWKLNSSWIQNLPYYSKLIEISIKSLKRGMKIMGLILLWENFLLWAH